MHAYQRALSAYLEPDDRTQEALAAAIGKTQPAVHRYANGRFPDKDTARAIDKATGGAVPFATWQQVALERIGIAA